jgi:hypothetical protein
MPGIVHFGERMRGARAALKRKQQSHARPHSMSQVIEPPPPPLGGGEVTVIVTMAGADAIP